MTIHDALAVPASSGAGVADLFADAVRQVLADQCTPAVVRGIEAGQAHAALWQSLEDAGFADALVPEALGGAGLSLAEVFPVLALCGAFALPLPLGETLLARAVLAQAGVAIPQGSIALAQAKETPQEVPDPANGLDSVVSLVCDGVPCGRVADWVLVVHLDQTYLLPVARAVSSPSSFVIDARLVWSPQEVAAAVRLPRAPDLRLLQGCVHAALLAGALQTVFNSSLQYANDRVQFGRPIGKFQAIQHQLSVMAEHAFAARMAAQIGCQSGTAMPDRLRVGVAKARTSEAALEVAALAHSIHGAIGFTEAFDLQLFTRRLHQWRSVGGSESYWHTQLGLALLDSGSALSLDLLRTATDRV